MFGMSSNDIGIDLGTASILVYIKGKGVVLKEPSVVAIDRDSNRILAIGEEARLMIGRTPGNIIAIRPLRHGVISDYTVTEKMLKYFINKAVGKKTLLRPRIAVCIPSGATEVERKAVEDATYQAGAKEVSIIEEPVAAAIGAGIDISKACGNMIVDIGGGTTDIGRGAGPLHAEKAQPADRRADRRGHQDPDRRGIPPSGGPYHGSPRTQPGDGTSEDHRGHFG